MHDDDKDADRPRRLADKAKEISIFFGERQRYYAARAQDYGYSKDIFQALGASFDKISDNPVFLATEKSLGKFHEFMQTREAQANKYQFNVSSASYALASTVSSTVSTVSISDVQVWLNNKVQPLTPPPNWSKDHVESYAKKLDMLDPELGRIARSIWQSFYGGTDNGERASLFLMRQLYDHFFSVLAPDDDVRKSTFFKKKDGKQPLQVHRKERLQYAAFFRVSDKSLGELLSDEVDQILETYERLNKLHSRNPLIPNDVKNLLMPMQAVIEQWINAIGL